MRVREGDERDADALIGMFDEAVEWLVARGSEGQWGTRSWSANPERVQRERERAAAGGLWIAEEDGEAVGALIVKEEAPPYVPPRRERELYVRLLLTSRRFKGRGVGALLLAHARAQAVQRGIGLLRVDCWAGGDGRLAEYYTGQGFTPTATFTVPDREWKGQVLEMRLTPEGISGGGV